MAESTFFHRGWALKGLAGEVCGGATSCPSALPVRPALCPLRPTWNSWPEPGPPRGHFSRARSSAGDIGPSHLCGRQSALTITTSLISLSPTDALDARGWGKQLLGSMECRSWGQGHLCHSSITVHPTGDPAGLQVSRRPSPGQTCRRHMPDVECKTRSPAVARPRRSASAQAHVCLRSPRHCSTRPGASESPTFRPLPAHPAHWLSLPRPLHSSGPCPPPSEPITLAAVGDPSLELQSQVRTLAVMDPSLPHPGANISHLGVGERRRSSPSPRESLPNTVWQEARALEVTAAAEDLPLCRWDPEASPEQGSWGQPELRLELQQSGVKVAQL